MRQLRPEVFEVRIHRNNYDDRTTIEVWSRMYDIRLGFALRHAWGDPRPLAEFCEVLVGGTVWAWHEARVRPDSGREMARALFPHWEREIHHAMERLEYEVRRRDRYEYVGRLDQIIPPDAMFLGEFGMDWAGPREDPKATEKARQLLMRNLDDGQLKSFKKDKTFRVTATDGKVYTISHARSFNVTAPDGTRYCGQLTDTPIEDQMLAQKLLLEHEPDKFFKNANVSPAYSGAGSIQSGTGVNMTATEIMQRQQWGGRW